MTQPVTLDSVRVMAKKQKADRRHRGVRLLTLPDGRNVARWVDPISRRDVQQSMDLLGLTSVRTRVIWAIEKAAAIKSLKAQLAIAGPVQMRMPVVAAVRDYLARFDRPNTVASQKLPLDEFAAFAAARGVSTMQDMVSPLLAQYGDHVRRPASPLAPGSKNLRLIVASGLLRWAKRNGWLPRVTVDEIAAALAKVKAEPKTIEVLRPAQVAQLLRAAIAHDDDGHERMAPFILLGLATGCRFLELCNLTWSEVDTTEGTIALSAERTKTRRGRVVTMAESPVALELLKALRMTAAKGQERVFPKMTRGGAWNARRRLIASYGAPEWTPHGLRRTCGSVLACSSIYASGAGPFLASKRLGHSLRIAEQSYLGALRDLPHDAATIEAVLGVEDLASIIVRRVALPERGAAAI